MFVFPSLVIVKLINILWYFLCKLKYFITQNIFHSETTIFLNIFKFRMQRFGFVVVVLFLLTSRFTIIN